MFLSGSQDFGNVSSNYQGNINSAQERVQNEFGTGAGDCVSLDLLIKRLLDRIVSERLKSKPDQYYLTALEERKNIMSDGFSKNNCSEKIEKAKQVQSALLLTKEAIKSEESVLPTNNNEQKIYIGAGALLLLVGLYIIVNK